ncbi:MAG: hypothetical protein CVU05_12920 [Bacteroidetes bacterium HGW-Bacteroidetes-21]|nr:MAG: hypothetical protein CVU05_12920 [Bacteroidetes bacterium HGW-Bacteroidetes-21]
MKAYTSKRFVIISIAIYILGLFIYAFYIYKTERNEVFNNIDEDLVHAAESTEYLLPEDYHDRALNKDSISQYEYYEIVYKLSKHVENYKIKYIYSLIKSNDKLMFTSSSATKEEISTGVNFTKFWDEYTEANKDFFNVFDSQEPVFSEYTDRWGTFRSVLIRKVSPKKHVYVVGADFEINYVEGLLLSKALRTIFGGLFLLLISLPIFFAIRFFFKNRANEMKTIIDKKTHELEDEINNNAEANEKIKYSEEKFSKIFDKTPQILIIVESNTGNIIDVNSKFLEISMLRRNEIIGSFILTIPFFVTATDYEYIKKIIDEKGFIRDLEISFKAKKENCYGILYAEVLHIKNRKHIMFIVQDVTKPKRLEKEVLMAKEKAEMSDRLKSAFLANMSHEIRTPLNSIIGFAQLLKSEELDLEKRNEFLDIIYSNGNSLLAIINDIIDFSKIEAGQLKINYNDIQLNSLLRKMLNVIIREKNERKKDELEIKLTLGLEDSSSIIRTDDIRITQIVLNLLTNALKFTEKGEILFGYEVNGDFIQLFVKDSGIGIPQDKQVVIFDRFQQIMETRTRQYSGTGLGLSISKALVELMGGRIWVNSVEGEGSTFFFSIPFRKPRAELVAQALEEPKVVVNKLKGTIILIADDDKASLTLLKHIFIREGATVIVASDGKEVIEKFRSNAGIKIVLLDINMPEKDGYQVMRELRKLSDKVKIVFQTALALSEERAKIEKSGCDACLFKPIIPTDLIETINGLIETN